MAAVGGQLVKSLGYILVVFGQRDRSQRRENVGGSPETDFQGRATVLDPFGVIVADLWPDRLSET